MGRRNYYTPMPFRAGERVRVIKGRYRGHIATVQQLISAGTDFLGSHYYESAVLDITPTAHFGGATERLTFDHFERAEEEEPAEEG